jgi:hypothetical protein
MKSLQNAMFTRLLASKQTVKIAAGEVPFPLVLVLAVQRPLIAPPVRSHIQ